MTVVRVEPSGFEFDVRPGESVAEAAWRLGYSWPTTCWGQAECMLCFVRVTAGELHTEPPDDDELLQMQTRMPAALEDSGDQARLQAEGQRPRSRGREEGCAGTADRDHLTPVGRSRWARRRVPGHSMRTPGARRCEPSWDGAVGSAHAGAGDLRGGRPTRDVDPQEGHLVVGDLRAVRPGRARGLRLRSSAQPDPRRVAPDRHSGRPRQRRRRHAHPRVPRWSTTKRPWRPWTIALQEHQMWVEGRLSTSAGHGCRTAVDGLIEHRDLLALLLVWEIGKPWRLACADVDRCIDGVRWYLGQIERQLDVERRHAAPAAAGSGVEHRQLELPDERAGPRRAGAGPGRQRGGGQDAEPGGLPHPDPGPRPHATRRAARSR